MALNAEATTNMADKANEPIMVVYFFFQELGLSTFSTFSLLGELNNGGL